MNFEEAEAKTILKNSGVPIPEGEVCNNADAAAAVAQRLGPSAIKAQVPTGKRGKAGGIRLVNSASAAATEARSLLGTEINGYRIERVLVEAQIDIDKEFYAAVMNDVERRAPLILFSSAGGMDIEEIAAQRPDTIIRIPASIGRPLESSDVRLSLAEGGQTEDVESITDFLMRLYQIYLETDAELLEINPLARTSDGSFIAVDCKLTLDDAALFRQPDLADRGAPENLTDLESRAKSVGLKYIELPGNVGILANGAGLTMTTMDVIAHYGGAPANFLEIGGDAYTKATPALELVLGNPRVKSVIVNFCGAFARTDVMAEGVVQAWETLKPQLPVFFSVHGTGERDAVRLIKERLNIEPYDLMEEAIRASVEAAR